MDSDGPIPEKDLDRFEFVIYEDMIHDLTGASKAHRNNVYNQVDEIMNEFRGKDINREDIETIIDLTFDDVWSLVDETGVSLWMRDNDSGSERPLYTRSPVGVWQSAMPDFCSEDSEETVSDYFYKAVYEMTVDDDETGWSNPTEETMENLSESEEEIILSLRLVYVEMTKMTPELVILFEKAKSKFEDS